MVSMRMMSAPPASRPLACSPYAATSSIKVTFLNPGLVTDGEIESDRLVGPMAPATRRGREGSASMTSRHTRLASCAASLLRRKARCASL